MAITAHDVATFSQILVVIVTATMLLAFLYLRMQKKCGWEVIFVASVEMVMYAAQIATPNRGNVKLAHAGYFPWFRYVAWLLTCPTIIVNVTNLTGFGKGNFVKYTMGGVTSNLFITICGITADLYSNYLVIKGISYCVGCIGLIVMYYIIIQSIQETQKSIAEEARSLLRLATGIMLSTWLMFPVLFLLGPTMTGILSLDQYVIGQSLGDLLSKNLYSALSWKCRWTHKKKSQLRANLHECRTTLQVQSGSPSFAEEHKDATIHGFGPDKYEAHGTSLTFHPENTKFRWNSPTPQHSIMPMGTRLNVLLVEKDVAYQKVFLQMVSHFPGQSIHFETAFDLEHAELVMNRGTPVDVVLLSISNKTIPQSMATLPKSLPSAIVAYSMHKSQDDCLGRMKELGISYFVENPLNESDLVAAITSCVSDVVTVSM